MKIINADPGYGVPMKEGEAKDFLERSKMNLQLATIDNKDEPVVQPVWYYYDRASNLLYTETGKSSLKVRNIRRKNRVYFSVDDEAMPYKGVKGKAKVRILEDAEKNLPIAEKIMVKYLGSADHPMAKQLLGGVRSGQSIILEFAPAYFSTWDFGKKS
jgi:nitroimidazol reductase NimA-like FMN-containing flavoprotein (pyridoxamine 5'-phosphate oxidase superfamily)